MKPWLNYTAFIVAYLLALFRLCYMPSIFTVITSIVLQIVLIAAVGRYIKGKMENIIWLSCLCVAALSLVPFSR